MRLETLRIINFRGFRDREFYLHPQFNLVIGENGAGKTSFLEAAAVAVGSWLLGFPGYDSRNIRDNDIRNVLELVERRYRVLPQYPVRVQATGFVHIAQVERARLNEAIRYRAAGRSGEKAPREHYVRWERSVDNVGRKTSRKDARELRKQAELMAAAVLKQDPFILPLIRYFGAGRLWESVRDSPSKVLSKNGGKQPGELTEDADEIDLAINDGSRMLEPFYGYRMSVDKRCNPDDLIRWMGVERRNQLDEGISSSALNIVYRAVETMLPELRSARYSTKLRTLVLRYLNGERRSFSELSDGYRNVLAIAADIAIKAVMLNPQLAEMALEMTPGVVLIDELDLHLHPKWQRRIIADLRRTFPLIQFICTTHSPFLVQSLRSGEELIVLDGQPTADLGHMPLGEISTGIMGVSNSEVSQEYEAMREAAKYYLEVLEEATMAPKEKQAEFKRRLAEAIAPYAHNPAYQAFLEMQRVAKLGG
jgi:predicted ATP-binding protein involved in virulence